MFRDKKFILNRLTNFRLTLSQTFYGVGIFLTRDHLFIHFNKSDIENKIQDYRIRTLANTT